MGDLERAIDLNAGAVSGAFKLLPAKLDTKAARVQLLAIAGQESGLIHQRQVGGPARGLMQFEQGGGVIGVMQHKVSRDLAATVCEKLGIRFDSGAVMMALADTGSLDRLDFAFGRLLLLTDPQAVPDIGRLEEAWLMYKRVWRPGKPHRDRWDYWYEIAVKAVA